jgi:hypothetical protein
LAPLTAAQQDMSTRTGRPSARSSAAVDLLDLLELAETEGMLR